MTTQPTPSSKSTKAELLAAFEALRQKYADSAAEQIKPPALRRAEEDRIVAKTTAYTPATIDTELATLRRKLQEHLDDMGRELAEESRKLTDLREALAIKAARLQETRHLELSAEALDVLLADYARAEQEHASKRAAAEAEFAAARARQQIEWEREQEEYVYNLKISRKKEHDASEAEYAKQDAAREEKFIAKTKELTEREAALAARQAEVARLEKIVADYPATLEKATREAVDSTTENLRKEFAIEKRLLEQDWKAQKAMLETRLENLQDTTKTQTQDMLALKHSLDAATQHAQTLAATVIESVSGMKQPKPAETAKE